MRRKIFNLLLSFELITCGEKLSQQYTQTGFLSGSAQIGQCAGDRKCSSAHRRRRRCSCRLWQETACSATPCVCEQMDDAVNYDYTLIFFLTRFSQDKSDVHLEPRREKENTACRNARARVNAFTLEMCRCGRCKVYTGEVRSSVLDQEFHHYPPNLAG